jgi:3-phosphoshikimate 1-carboxyvinyltransferase
VLTSQFKNKKNYKGELVADISIASTKRLKPINCPPKLNSGAIDEFLIIFLVAAKANGEFLTLKILVNLTKRKVPDWKWGAKILNKMGVKTKTTDSSIKIFGNPNLTINKRDYH